MPPDLDALQRADRYDLLADEAQLEAYAVGAVRRPSACALAGWMPADRVELGRAGALRAVEAEALATGTGSAPSRTAGSRAWNRRWPT